MWHAAQIAEAIHQYGPDYGFDTTVNRFEWRTLVNNRSAYIDRIHHSYDNVLGKTRWTSFGGSPALLMHTA